MATRLGLTRDSYQLLVDALCNKTIEHYIQFSDDRLYITIIIRVRLYKINSLLLE